MRAINWLLAATFCCASAHAQVPEQIGYQGVLVDAGGQPVNGLVPMLFRLYSMPSGGSALYSETQTVNVTNGVFNVAIGAVTPVSLPFDTPYYLGIKVGTDAEMTPRQALLSSPYARRAEMANALAGTASLSASQLSGTIGTAQIADNAVTQAKLSPVSGVAAGKVLGTDGSNLVWQSPVAGGGTVTSVDTGSGLTGGPITGTGTISLVATQLLPTTACTNGQVPKWNGSGWACAADATGAAGDAFVLYGNAFGDAATMGTKDNFPMEIIANSQRALRITPNGTSPNITAGHFSNAASAARMPDKPSAVGAQAGSCNYDIGGGTVARLCRNFTAADFATVAGGLGNQAIGYLSVVGGGESNDSTGFASTVGGGFANVSSDQYSTVAGGFANTASGLTGSTVSGGRDNVASGSDSTVPGGSYNVASGSVSFAAGEYANANEWNCFVFAGWTFIPNVRPNCLGTSNIARFMLDHGLSVDYHSARPDGGGNRWVYIGDIFAGDTIRAWNGAHLTDGGAWTDNSDRTTKQGFVAVEPSDVLERVVALPITTWSYVAENEKVRHMGAMAQDFHAAFGLGTDDKHISALDTGGVALAAIQGLNAKLEEQVAALQRQLADKDTKMAAHSARIDALATQAAEIAMLKQEVALMAQLLRQATRVAQVAGPLTAGILPAAR